MPNLWDTCPRYRPLRPGEQLATDTLVTVDGALFRFVLWQWCGKDRYALLDCMHCSGQHVAADTRLMVEAGDDGNSDQSTAGKATRTGLRGRTSAADKRGRHA